MFSIVIPLYNKEHRIEETIDSVLKQTFLDYELIIVDDGSTDQSLKIVQKYLSDNRVKIIEQKNQGVSVARNNGVLKSSFDYIAFLDGDDEWEPTYLEKMADIVKKNPGAGMYCSAGFYKNVKTKCIHTRICERYENQVLTVNYFENPHVLTHTSATIVSKQYFNKVPGGFPKGMKKNEDLALFYSLALISDVIYSGFPLSYYCYNVDNQATEINKKAYHDVSNRFNLTFNLWDSYKSKNKFFIIFLKYELRHIFISYIRENNYEAINAHLDTLDNKLLSKFSKFELFLIKTSSLKLASTLYILFTKALWRLNGFPRSTTSKIVKNCK